MNRAFVTSVLVILAGSVFAAPLPAPSTPDKPAVVPGEFVYESVLNGLIEDGVSPLLAVALTKQPTEPMQYPYFLAKCPLCNPTLRAFEEYAKRTEAAKPKEGKGLPAELAKQLGSTDHDVRRAALRAVVAIYVERGYARTELSAESRRELEKELLRMRGDPKDLANGVKFCPSCDGVCRLVPNK